MLNTEWIEKGFVDEPVPAGANLKEEIRRMCREKKAIVLAHYYTRGEIQEVADFVGDSLALARKAAETDAETMVMCGVHFMAETCKILSPDKTVLAPDLGAGCSLADRLTTCSPHSLCMRVQKSSMTSRSWGMSILLRIKSTAMPSVFAAMTAFQTNHGLKAGRGAKTTATRSRLEASSLVRHSSLR